MKSGSASKTPAKQLLLSVFYSQGTCGERGEATGTRSRSWWAEELRFHWSSPNSKATPLPGHPSSLDEFLLHMLESWSRQEKLPQICILGNDLLPLNPTPGDTIFVLRALFRLLLPLEFLAETKVRN